MRDVDPFSYWPEHSSAIRGFGGSNLSPDPRYLFHTNYLEVRPGPASYELKISGGRASYGELMIRVHAVRPDSGQDASLVGGARLNLVAEELQDYAVHVRFAAQRGVHYAFYGYFLEEFQINADGLRVLLNESEGDEEIYPEPPRSVLAYPEALGDVRPPNALVHVIPPRLAAPVSQACTAAQLSELKAKLHSVGSFNDWAEALCMNALSTYGMNVPALEGLMVGPCSDRFSELMTQCGFSMTHMDADPPPTPKSDVFADFVLWPEGLHGEPDAERRWDICKAWLGRLKIGGLGVIVVYFRPENGPPRSNPTDDGDSVTRNEIGRWALRLIGEGYSVAPLAFSSAEDLAVDNDGFSRFVLIASRK